MFSLSIDFCHFDGQNELFSWCRCRGPSGWKWRCGWCKGVQQCENSGRFGLLCGTLGFLKRSGVVFTGQETYVVPGVCYCMGFMGPWIDGGICAEVWHGCAGRAYCVINVADKSSKETSREWWHNGCSVHDVLKRWCGWSAASDVIEKKKKKRIIFIWRWMQRTQLRKKRTKVLTNDYKTFGHDTLLVLRNWYML